jgi:hypothetical protein
VIFTGTGGHFIAGIDFSSFGSVADAAVWTQVLDEGVQILENLLNTRVPVIARVEGRLDAHSEYAATQPDGSLNEVTSVRIVHNSPQGLAGF